jgi:hypothetical protein
LHRFGINCDSLAATRVDAPRHETRLSENREPAQADQCYASRIIAIPHRASRDSRRQLCAISIAFVTLPSLQSPGSLYFRRIVMKSVALLILALCAFCGPAIAQTTECQSIPKASDRLACYDKAKPPMSKAKPAAASTAPSTPQGQPGDLLAAENARLDARINNICRGC